MKKIIKTAAYLVLAGAAFACAKAVEAGPNEAEIRYFEAWMQVNHPDLQPTGLGIYVLEEEEGTGSVTVEGDGFAYVDYVITDLEGNITSYTDKYTAKKLGQYDTTTYYGPQVMTTIEQTLPAGLAEALVGMKEGGRKKVIIPSWLMTYSVFDSAEEYLANASTSESTIYDITVRNFTDSIPALEDRQIKDYMYKNQAVFNDWKQPVADTVFYYQQLRKPEEGAEAFSKDTTIYINYTGRLLNGLVFDTTDEKTAKDNGLYSSSRTYEPVQINWGEKWSDITMGSSESDIIQGFALTLWQMRPMEKGIGIFYSPLGYSYSGSGRSIPGYAPLIFEIEIVAKPED